MVNFQFLSGLNTIGANIIDIQSNSGRIIFDYGEIFDSNLGRLPEWEDSIENTAIFISHLHIDHIGSLDQVPAEVPIYMSVDSYRLYQWLIEIEEEQAIQATVYPLNYNEIKTVGDIQVFFKKSDHDIEGACAIFVQTPDVKLINSGDVRLSGNFPENVNKWMEEGNKFKPDIFLLEGTSFSFEEESEIENEVTEKEMYDKWQNLLKENQQEIIFINPYIRDITRVYNLSTITQMNGRKIVLEPKYAYLLEKYHKSLDFFVLKELDRKQYFKKNWISLEEIQKDPKKYVLQNTFENRMFMKMFEKGVYCHSNGEPLGDYDVRYQNLVSTIEDHNFTFKDFNVSGHATQEDIVAIAKEVDAKITIPWHSFKPEKLMESLMAAGLSTFLPEKDTIYSLNRLNKNVVG